MRELNQYFLVFHCSKSIEKYSMFWVFPERYAEKYYQNTEQYAGDSECQEEVLFEIKALAIIRECCKNKKELPDEW